MTRTGTDWIDGGMTLDDQARQEPALESEFERHSAIDREVRALRPIYAGEIVALKRRGARRQTLRRLGLAFAAGGTALVLGVFLTGWRNLAPEPGATLIQAMADGSRIFLDAGSSLDIPLAPWRREARLIKGDALFDIVHDTNHPFVVHAAGSRLTDLGTRFLVQSNDKTINLAVFEGKVEIASATGHKLALAVGQAVRAGTDGIAALPMPDEAEATAWRQGRLVFRDTPLDQVAARLSRYRAQPVVMGSPSLARLKVNGSFRLDDLDGALRTLEKALPVRVHDKDGVAVLEPSSRRH